MSSERALATSAGKTLKFPSRAAGATPDGSYGMSTPSKVAGVCSVHATVPATWVPCPFRSAGV